MSNDDPIEVLLAQLSVAEKVALCHAGSKFAVAGVPRLGIPEWTMSDGPHGVRQEIAKDSWDPVGGDADFATYLPTGTALAATWNTALGRLFGEALGAEARSRGKDVILGPGINIIRTPLCGRNFEYYSEDPHLIARMVVPAIQGIQSQDVAACVKHFALNNQELDRHGTDVQVDERALREIYLPGFRAAVEEAGVLTVMGAYNLFRGQHCCHHAYLLNAILKGEWQFQGAVISDWAGTHDAREAALNGLDVEMGTPKPYTDYFLATPLLEAIHSGAVPESVLDNKVRRNLRVMAATKMFAPESRKPGARNTAAHRQAAQRIAAEAMVLLKNDRAVLPLTGIRSLLVVGENATVKHHAGGNSSAVKAEYEVTPLDGLQQAVGDTVAITYIRGGAAAGAAKPIPVERLGVAEAGSGARGWRLELFADAKFRGEPVLDRITDGVAMEWAGNRPADASANVPHSARWSATVHPDQPGMYEFVLHGAEHADLWVDGERLIQRWESAGPTRVAKSMHLAAGRAYGLQVRLRPAAGGGPVSVRLDWNPPSADSASGSGGGELAAILAAARAADAVLFVGGLNHQYDVEGCDRRDMALHDGQNELIAALATANSRLAIVLVSGCPVEMPWLEQVPAVLQMWYAGMEGGHALADILLGRVNPSGKLPFTFPRQLAESPAHQYGEYRAGVCHYHEGLYVGYRYFCTRNVPVLFPFGHGLSYTTFAYSDLVITSAETGEKSLARARLTVTNTGSRAGAEVVQLYVHDDACSLDRPDRELKAFAKVHLAPGESRSVEFELGPEAFSFYHPEHGWILEPGAFTILVGSSCTDIRLTERFVV